MSNPGASHPDFSVSPTMVETIARHIDRMIGRGMLQPGDSLSEPALSATLGVGRVPVREAIRILAGEGVLELVPNRSARVRLVGANEILEMMDVLSAFTVMAMHLLAAQPIPPNLANELRTAADRIEEFAKADRSGDELMQTISIFHYRLIKAAGNNYLLGLLAKTRINYYSRYLVALLGRQAFADSAPAYGKMVSALDRNDSKAAIRIFLRSVDRSKTHATLDGWLARVGRTATLAAQD